VHAVHPDVNILAPAQIALAKVSVFFLAAGGQPGDIGRRQAGSLAQKRFDSSTRGAPCSTVPGPNVTLAVMALNESSTSALSASISIRHAPSRAIRDKSSLPASL
jgi:hypothetical protein